MSELNPADRLTAPEETAPMPTWTEQVLGFTDLFSVTAWVREACKTFIDVDPVTWFSEWVMGDWKQVGLAESAVLNAEKFHADFAANMDSLIPGLAWEGNAASSAGEYFGRVAEVLRDQQTAIAEAAAGLAELKNSIYFSLKTLEGLISATLDLVIELALEAIVAAAAGAPTVGVGAIPGLAAMALTVIKALGKWAQVIEAIGHMMTAVYGLTGLVQAMTTSLETSSTIPMPGAAYDHPGVD